MTNGPRIKVSQNHEPYNASARRHVEYNGDYPLGPSVTWPTGEERGSACSLRLAVSSFNRRKQGNRGSLQNSRERDDSRWKFITRTWFDSAHQPQALLTLLRFTVGSFTQINCLGLMELSTLPAHWTIHAMPRQLLKWQEHQLTTSSEPPCNDLGWQWMVFVIPQMNGRLIDASSINYMARAFGTGIMSTGGEEVTGGRNTVDWWNILLFYNNFKVIDHQRNTRLNKGCL